LFFRSSIPVNIFLRLLIKSIISSVVSFFSFL
jgi:hypothetical protein